VAAVLMPFPSGALHSSLFYISLWLLSLPAVIFYRRPPCPPPPRTLLMASVYAYLPIPLAWLFAHCNANPIYVFPEKELRGLSPNFHIYVSVSDVYIPRIDPHIFLQQNRQTDPGNI
jgi:hypothetical protein